MTDRSSAARLAEGLVGGYGVASHCWRYRPPVGLEHYRAYGASLGSAIPGARHDRVPISSRGTSFVDDGRAEVVCLAEAAERYAPGSRAGDDYPFVRAAELQGPVLTLRDIPMCSATELTDRRCPARPFDPDLPIRWTRGVDLRTSELTWVPAGMANYHLSARTANERFYFPLSTGHAVHIDLISATCKALLEVIERDAIAVTWLQMLELPRVPPRALTDVTGRTLEWCTANSVQLHLFDATTDLGVPIVYCLMRAPHDPLMTSAVSCAADVSISRAAESAVEDIVSFRVSDGALTGGPTSIDDIRDISDGARYMGTAERQHAFDFLLTGERQAPDREDLPDEPQKLLAVLRERLAERGMQSVVVNETVTELDRVDLHAVVAIVPRLMPMSLWPRAMFLAHPRLYELPESMGYLVHLEGELNPWPQPFA